MARIRVNVDAQIAMRRMFLNARGQLHKDAKTLAVALRRRLGAGSDRIVVMGRDGRVDEHATIVAAAQREIWEWLLATLNVEVYQTANLEDED